MHNDRLIILADYLDTQVPEEQLNMQDWLQGFEAPKSECGYVACAIGHACCVPAFRAEGLSLVPERAFNGLYYVPKYQDDTSWEAVRQFFGLDSDQADYLFVGEAYRTWKKGAGVTGFEYTPVTPQRVAERIRTLMEYNGRVYQAKALERSA